MDSPSETETKLHPPDQGRVLSVNEVHEHGVYRRIAPALFAVVGVMLLADLDTWACGKAESAHRTVRRRWSCSPGLVEVGRVTPGGLERSDS